MGRRAACAAALAALLLAAAELAARKAGAGPNNAESLLSWLLSERPVFVRTGAGYVTDPRLVALNDPAQKLAAVPPAGAPRIVCVGDSTTRGWPYHERGSYPAWLAAMLADLGPRAEVVNAGFHGFDSARLEAVAKETARLRPSIMIFRAGFNDAGLLRLREQPRRLLRLHLFLLEHSGAYAALRHGLSRPAARLAIGGADPRPLSEEQEDRLAASYRRRLAAMAAAARGAGATPIFLDLGDPARCGPLRRCARLQAELRSFAAEAGVSLVPLAAPLRGAHFVDDIHVDWDGYRRIALAAARAVCAEPAVARATPCRWDRLKPTQAYVAQLGLRDGEFLAHVHVGLAIMRLVDGRADEARRELAEAERVAPNARLVSEELAQFEDSQALALLKDNK